MRPFEPQLYHLSLLDRLLRQSFGDAVAASADLRNALRWVEIAGGETLLRQGDAGDAMYLVVSGRLRALIDDNGGPRPVRDLARGAPIGEIALFTEQARTATVIAVRDSVLVRLDRASFVALLDRGASASLALARHAIHRLQTEQRRDLPIELPVTLGLLAISQGVDLTAFSGALADGMRRAGTVQVIDSASAARSLQLPDDPKAWDQVATQRRLSEWLDEIEAAHDFTLLVGDAEATPWTRCIARQCDEVLLIADATQPPAPHDVERACLTGHAERAMAAQILVLLHPQDTQMPCGTRAWYAGRPLADHVHVRRGHVGDMARLARLQTRTATGLVLAGGGARGFAHLGVWQALTEQGIEIDCIGGTSMGAVMGFLIATDQERERVLAVTRDAFGRKPTSDFNLLPLISLIRGSRMRAVLQQALQTLMGRRNADIEDLWKRFYCIASNYTQAREVTLDSGPLDRALRASTAIPGALPPVVAEGELLFDGGTLNNFPVDVMRGLRGVGRVIGVDLNTKNLRRLDFDEVPGPWTLLLDRLRGRARRKYRLPTLASYLMNVTVLYSLSRQREGKRLADLYFNPPLFRVGMLQWDQVDRIVRQGYEHAREVLGASKASPPGKA